MGTILKLLQEEDLVAVPREHLRNVTNKILGGKLRSVREVELALLSCRKVWFTSLKRTSSNNASQADMQYGNV